MKAIRIHEYGHSDRMTLESVPEPVVGKGQVVVKIHDAGVNPVDWKIREGYLKDARPASFPLTLGQDFAGTVVTTGEGVSGFDKGDRVFGFAEGSYAEYALASPDGLARLPASVDFEVAASIPTAGLTAWQIVMDEARLSSGQTVLIHGAGGGVGSFAIQLCKMAGASMIATASAEDLPYLEQLGVERLIDYRSERFEDWAKDVDIAIDLVGGDTLKRSYDVVKGGGLIITTVGGADDAQAKKRGIRLVHFFMKRNARELEQLGRLVDEGLIRPRIGAVMPLSEAREAEDLSQRGHPRGKVVLRVV